MKQNLKGNGICSRGYNHDGSTRFEYKELYTDDKIIFTARLELNKNSKRDLQLIAKQDKIISSPLLYELKSYYADIKRQINDDFSGTSLDKKNDYLERKLEELNKKRGITQ